MSGAPRIALTVLGIAGFVALLFYGAMSHSQVTCEVCVSYGGRQDCRESRGEDQAAAIQGAHSAACANLTSGVTNAFRCSQTSPTSTRCTRN